MLATSKVCACAPRRETNEIARQMNAFFTVLPFPPFSSRDRLADPGAMVFKRARHEDELDASGVRAVFRQAGRHVDRVADMQRVSGEALPAQREPSEQLHLPVDDAASFVLYVHEHEHVWIPPLDLPDGADERHGLPSVV